MVEGFWRKKIDSWEHIAKEGGKEAEDFEKGLHCTFNKSHITKK